jgi:enoyl-CoA hydratase/carnithine racemase
MPAGEEKESDIAVMANWTYMDGFKTLPALMAIKDSVNRAAESSLAEGIVYERRQLHARFASDDAREGMSAFLEKRPPQFQHC